MPIYEYVCRDCRLEFEALLRIDQRPSCQSCGSEQLERLLSVPAAPQRGPAKGSGQGGSAKSSSGGEGPRPCGMGGCGLPECE
jgi:putative FmdB family regulatory protein